MLLKRNKAIALPVDLHKYGVFIGLGNLATTKKIE